MPAPRSGAGLRMAAGALLMGTLIGRPHGACAATVSYDVSDRAVVQVISRSASVTIHTWSRNTVQIDYPDGDGFVPSKGTQETRSSFLIPTVNVEERSPDGAFAATLLPEDFPVPKLIPGMHDVVRVIEVVRPADVGKAPPAEELTVTIPESTGLLNVRSGSGAVSLSDYHGTTITAVGRGRIAFDNVSGDAFVQPLNGSFYATDSTFDRLRIRSNRGNLIFDACRVSQIEATTLTGTIVFDNGTFDPGLARFESDRGSIALGVNGGAQVGAHTQDGHVLTVLPSAPPVLGRDQSDTLQLAGTGGPLVNASSKHGDVLLYDGSLADRHPATLSPPWHTMYGLFVSNRETARRRAADMRSMPPVQAQPQRRPSLPQAAHGRRRWVPPPHAPRSPSE